jgi:hypothetical protein
MIDERRATHNAKQPYGDVDYADPGYLDASGNQAKGGNGVKRYPIDAEHVQAAWSYINMPKNQKGYTAEQLAAVKSRIKAAMKKFGHEVSEDNQSALRRDLIRLAELGQTLTAVAATAERRNLSPDFVAELGLAQRIFEAMNKKANRAAAKAGVSRDDGPQVDRCLSVAEADWELRSQALDADPATTVSAGLRRIDAVAASTVPEPAGAERICLDCSAPFTSVAGARRCPDCAASAEARRAAAVAAAANRPAATRISDAWGELAEADAEATKHELRRRGLSR